MVIAVETVAITPRAKRLKNDCVILLLSWLSIIAIITGQRYTFNHYNQIKSIIRALHNHIKIQAHYECRRHDTPAKPRVQWGQSPIWNPGYTQIKTNWAPLGAALTAQVLGSAAPLGLNKCVPIINPGLAPWAMQEYRPYRASLRLPIYFIILMRFPTIRLAN